jgi:hypothetical protein
MQLTQSLASYFRTEVDQAFRTEGLRPGEMTEVYLVQLLADYAAQPIDDAPLALRLMEAMTEPPHERRQHLRQIGDTSLFVSGFWTDSLERKWVDVDYYIALGGSAYGQLAQAVPGTSGEKFRPVFAELAENFGRFVEVLMTIQRRARGSQSPADVVRLYERWMRTKSRWAARQLAEAGVLPVPRRRGMVQ